MLRSVSRKPFEPIALSFVIVKGNGGEGYDYWNVESTGAYGTDCDKGRALAEEYLTYLGTHPTFGNAALLQSIVDSMMAKRSAPNTSWGRHTTGLEVGFLQAVNEYAMATARIVKDSTFAA